MQESRPFRYEPRPQLNCHFDRSRGFHPILSEFFRSDSFTRRARDVGIVGVVGSGLHDISIERLPSVPYFVLATRGGRNLICPTERDRLMYLRRELRPPSLRFIGPGSSLIDVQIYLK